MLITLILLGVLALIAIAATIVTVARDGYRAQPTADRDLTPPPSSAAEWVNPFRLA